MPRLGLGLGLGLNSSLGGPAVALNPPVNTVAPAITGTPTVGQTLTVSNGTWTNSPTSFAYQWRRNGSDIAGATANTYALVSDDAGTMISCLVTATNADGQSSSVTGDLSITAPEMPYLPTTPAPQFAYSTEKLWSSVTTPSLRAVRPSDGATMDFPFAANGSLDMSGYAAFAGSGDLTVSRWKDQAYVVNGGAAETNDAVQATAGNQPRLRAGNAMRGKQPISMGLQADGRIASDRCLSLPSVANTRCSTTRMWVGSLIGGTFNSIGIWGLGTGAGAADNLSLIYDTTSGKAAFYTLDSAFNSGIGGPPTAELAVFTYISGPSSRSMYINGQLVNTLATPATDIALTGGWIGRGSWSATSNGPAEFAADINWSTALSDADRIAFESVLASRFGITYAAYSKLIAYDGHSIIAGMNESGYFQNLPRQINENWSGLLPKTPNFGVAGQTALQIFNRRAATATAANAAGFGKKAHVVCMATNSVEALASGSIVGGGATIYSTYILPYIQYMQTNGGFGAGVIYLTDPPRAWTGSTTDIGQKEAEMQSIISLLKADASAQGFTVVDWHNMPEMTTGSPTGGNPLPPNPAVYGVASGVHPSPAGYAVVRPALQSVIEGLLG